MNPHFAFYSLIVSMVFGKRQKSESGPIAVNTVGYVGGAPIFIPMLWFAGRGFEFSKVTPAAWAGVIFAGVYVTERFG